MLLATLEKVANYGPDQENVTLSGLLGAAAFGVSAWIGRRRTSACRDAEAAAVGGPPIQAATRRRLERGRDTGSSVCKFSARRT